MKNYSVKYTDIEGRQYTDTCFAESKEDAAETIKDSIWDLVNIMSVEEMV